MAATLTPQERDALLTRFHDISSDGPLNILTRERFTTLASVECDDGPVISLYVDLSPQNRHNNAWEIDVKTQARDVLTRLTDREQTEVVKAEVDRMHRWLEDNVSSMGRGAALFSCPSQDLWWPISLPLALPTRLRVGRRPYLRPLARIRDEHDRFAVVSLDKQRARLFLSQLGFLQEVADIFEDTPRHHKQGGRSQMRFQRHHDAHVMWHAGAVAQATELLMDRLEARHLIVSGSPQVLAEYRDALSPKAVKGWVGEFGLAIDAPDTELAEAIAPIQRETEQNEELSTIARINDAISWGKGVWGLAGTLNAVAEKRVKVLVVHDRYRPAGRECPQCEILFQAGSGACPACGRALKEVEDVVDAALERAVTQEAELELVRAVAAQRILPPGEPIGALLRF
jgi:hypothetical protein